MVRYDNSQNTGNDNNPVFNHDFGNGEVGDDSYEMKPTYATTDDDKNITIAEKSNGETLSARGHVSGEWFFGYKGEDDDGKPMSIGVHHDHRDKDGNMRSNGDRGAWW